MSANARLLSLAQHVAGSLASASAIRLADQLDLVGIEATLNGSPAPGVDEEWLAIGLAKVTDADVRHWEQQLANLAAAGTRLTTIADPDYPLNLRSIVNRPPFLFVRGSFTPADDRAIAVVGTRGVSADGLRAATDVSTALAERGVTVVSGLANGIDTAAHSAALNAHGRTIAVYGTGIRRVSPVGNRTLAMQIERHGACVSQFWPDQTGARWTFPVRNIVTSGLSVGTVVVEAGETSGARLQAEDALRHGKRLFLIDHLVMAQKWAQALTVHPRVDVMNDVDQIVAAIDMELRQPHVDGVLV